jgi:hypothetical protein
MRKIFIICEGKSEEKYIQGLRAILVSKAVDSLSIFPECFYGGKTYSEFLSGIKNAINTIKGRGRKFEDQIFIWIDKDRFLRELVHKKDDFEVYISNVKLPKNPIILYNHMSFEDFLILHYSEQGILALQSKLNHKNHFIKPLIAEEYVPIYKELIQDYSKGNLPDDFSFDLEKIKLCVNNIENENYRFKSDIKEILELVIQKCEE